MPQNIGDKSFMILAVLVFTACLLLMESLYFLWQSYRGKETRKLSRRMRALGGGQPEEESQVQVVKTVRFSGFAIVDTWLSRQQWALEIQRFLTQADTALTLSQLVMASLVAGLAGFLLVPNMGPLEPWPDLLAAAIGLCLPWALIAIKRARRLSKIETQFPDALDFITRALRSGQALTSAIMLAGEELQEPIAAEFRAVHDEITFGESFEKAMANFGDRLPLTDLRYFVVSVLIQRDSGGNLSEILEGLSRLIRERYKLLSKIRVLSADGRYSALILIIAPFALGYLMHLTNPEFIRLLWTDPIGISILKVLAILMLIGIYILRNITRIRV